MGAAPQLVPYQEPPSDPDDDKRNWWKEKAVEAVVWTIQWAAAVGSGIAIGWWAVLCFG